MNAPKNKLDETKSAAQKVEHVLRESAASLTEAKESMIIALLKENVDLHIIHHSTGTSIERILGIKESLQ